MAKKATEQHSHIKEMIFRHQGSNSSLYILYSYAVILLINLYYYMVTFKQSFCLKRKKEENNSVEIVFNWMISFCQDQSAFYYCSIWCCAAIPMHF